MTQLKKLPLNDIHESLGAKMTPFAGYSMPLKYTSDKDEHFKVREGVGVFDVSHMGEFFVKGPKAQDFIQSVTTNNVLKLDADGKAQYSCMTNENGGVIDDLIVYRISSDEYMLVVNGARANEDWDWLNKHKYSDVEMTNKTDDIVLLAVQGPKAIDVVQNLTDINVADIPFYNFKIGQSAGVDNVIISATGYTGAGGVELYIPSDKAATVWAKLFEAGQQAGIQPIGLGARDTLRLEKGYCLYGNDITESTNPLEAGLGWITKLDFDFIGADKLRAIKKNGTNRKLVAFKMTERGIPRKDYLIKDDSDNKIGFVTSGLHSPMLNKGIGLGYVAKENASVGNTIAVEIRNKPVKAEIVKLPFL